MTFRDIPGNDHALAALRALLKAREAIAFVGAGASAGLYPLWGKLLGGLMNAAVSRGLASEDDRSFWRKLQQKNPQQVVRGIKEKLGPGIYGDLLHDIFKPVRGADGNDFTPVHAAAVRLPFKGLVTTNYDQGLLLARLTLRPDIRDTGFATWKDAEPVHRWFTNKAFEGDSCPVLFAHGIHNRAETVILEAGEYREAYGGGAYRRLFDKLWGQERLVFVGFGFSDPWFDFLANDVLTQTAATVSSAPRHLAILGIPEGEMPSMEERRYFRDQYNAELLFYVVRELPDGSPDHSELKGLLGELVKEFGKPISATPAAVPAAAASRPAVPQLWVHETTNDRAFTGRQTVIERLDRWSADPAVRLIGVTGFGGLGKTALIGYWLKDRDGLSRRPYDGLFFWSFYNDRDPKACLDRLCEFAREELGWVRPPGDKDRPVREALSLLKQHSLLIVFDGLEVLQERAGGSQAFGRLLDEDLRAFLQNVARLDRGLIVLTSRFPFADLTPYVGTAARLLDLARLEPPEGAELLRRTGIDEPQATLEAFSRTLDGHPLALRILARAADASNVSAGEVVERIVRESHLDDGDPLQAKLRRLLQFYDEHLPPARRALLGVIALFRTPVPFETIDLLVHRLEGTKEAVNGLSEQDLRRELGHMADDLLLTREPLGEGPLGYAAHPVLRDHFRRRLLKRDTAAAGAVADLVADVPDAVVPQSIEELRPILTAIELLVEAGDYRRASDLYRQRLASGRVFLWLPAPTLGREAAVQFIADRWRRTACAKRLGRDRLNFFINDSGLFSLVAGETNTAEMLLHEGVSEGRRSGKKEHLPVRLRNLSELYIICGRLHEAAEAATEALHCAESEELETDKCFGIAQLASVAMIRGEVDAAIRLFVKSDSIAWARSGHGLVSYRGIEWGACLLKIERSDIAKKVIEVANNTAINNGWHNEVSRCYRLLSLMAISENDCGAAESLLANAESVFRRSQQIFDLIPVLVARAELARRQEKWEQAAAAVEEALSAAAPRELRLAQADALVERGRITLAMFRAGRLDRTDLPRAADDGEAGYRLARDCEYAWAERDACRLLAETYRALGNSREAGRWQAKAEQLTRRLTPTIELGLSEEGRVVILNDPEAPAGDEEE